MLYIWTGFNELSHCLNLVLSTRRKKLSHRNTMIDIFMTRLKDAPIWKCKTAMYRNVQSVISMYWWLFSNDGHFKIMCCNHIYFVFLSIIVSPVEKLVKLILFPAFFLYKSGICIYRIWLLWCSMYVFMWKIQLILWSMFLLDYHTSGDKSWTKLYWANRTLNGQEMQKR